MRRRSPHSLLCLILQCWNPEIIWLEQLEILRVYYNLVKLGFSEEPVRIKKN